MMPEYNIPQIFQRAFGFVNPIPQNNTPPTKIEYQVNSVKSYQNAPIKTSNLGNPVYEVLEFMYDDGIVAYTFPDNTYISADRSTLIEKTGIIKRLGKVKEYITLDDWQINVYGVILNYNSYDYPETEVAKLLRVMEQPHAFRIQGMSLHALGIYNVVVEKVQLQEVEGLAGAQPFTLQLVQDNPIELELKNV